MATLHADACDRVTAMAVEVERLTHEWQATQNINLSLHHKLDVLNVDGTRLAANNAHLIKHRNHFCDRMSEAMRETEGLRAEVERLKGFPQYAELYDEWQRLQKEVERLKSGACLACPSRNEAEFRASSLESDVARLTAERARLAAELSALRPDYCDTDDVAATLRAEDAEHERLCALGRAVEAMPHGSVMRRDVVTGLWFTKVCGGCGEHVGSIPIASLLAAGVGVGEEKRA